MSGDGFLSRWSRKKRGEAAEEAPAVETPRTDSPPEPTAEAPVQDAPLAESALSEDTLSEEELAALPPIETIDAGTDIAAFMRKGVPNALRNAALRKFWAASPMARDYLDPARDYAYDWNVPGGVPGDGPLGPGFDAKALADRLFGDRKREGASPPDDVARASQDVRETPEPSGHNAQHDGHTDDAAVGESAEVDLSPDAQNEAEHDLATGNEDALPAKTPRESGEFRTRPRRHGRATPV